MAHYTPMIQQYLSIKAEYKDAFLFFRLGDFYELFFEDATEASRLLEITLTGREGGAEERIPMCGVPYHSAAGYINRLVEIGHKVAICEQVEDPASAKGVVRREVIRVITPGTRMETGVLPEKSNNFMVSLATHAGITALGAVDLSTGECYVTEMYGTKQSVCDEMNSYHPAEVIIADEREAEELFEFIKKQSGCLVQKIRLTDDYDEMARVKRQFPNTYSDIKSALSAKVIAMMLHYLDETQKRSITHINRLQVYQANDYMVLDMFSRRNLELVSTIRDQAKKGSLLHHLDKTVTAMGGRMLRRWIEKPLMNEVLIEQRLQLVEELLSESILLEDIHDFLRNVYDLERLVSRIAYGNANARDLIMIKRSLDNVRPLKDRVASSSLSLWKDKLQGVDDCDDIRKKIEQAIVDEPPLSVKDGGMIKDGYHKTLDSYREASRSGKTWMAELEQRERERTKIKSLKIGYNKVFGYYIEVTKSNVGNLPEGLYERKQTLANAERYVTAELKEKEALILEAEEKLISLEYELLIELRETLAAEVTRLQQLANEMAFLDVIGAFTKTSLQFGYVRPRFTDERGITIKSGRHPVVESVLFPDPFVSNDTALEASKGQILLITGPNMAGKSTYMRQVAIIVIMAQIGCFVPAESATLSLVDRIFTRIGAADDVAGGQSTFMVEMVETRQAITEASSRSLLLLDEIGRGTATYDGMALAQSIIEYIHEHVGALTLFSTHYHELTELEHELDRLVNVNAKCIEKDGKVLFLHKIEQGRADRSYDIHVAQLANMPDKVIKRAQKILKQLEQQNGPQSQLAFIFDTAGAAEEIAAAHDSHIAERLGQLTDRIESIDIMNTTPIEAMQHLFQLKQWVKDSKG